MWENIKKKIKPGKSILFYPMHEKVTKEMQALEAYLFRVPVTERFYNTKIKIRVIVSNATDLTDEQFEILKQKIK